MPFEPTTKGNPYRLTKKQHFHMQAILKKFCFNRKLKVIDKNGGVSVCKSDSPCFMGNRAWSQEMETTISNPIERKFLFQVSRIENGEGISDHLAISDYHLLWCLRWHYSINDPEDYDLYKDFPCGSLDKEVEELLESWGKVPVRSGGKIAGRFKATLDIKQLLDENKHEYDGFKWQIVESQGKPFISADCYGDLMVMAISTKYYLIAGKELNEMHCFVTDDEVDELNLQSMNASHNFYFCSDDS
jgi:hypothetical protein